MHADMRLKLQLRILYGHMYASRSTGQVSEAWDSLLRKIECCRIIAIIIRKEAIVELIMLLLKAIAYYYKQYE